VWTLEAAAYRLSLIRLAIVVARNNSSHLNTKGHVDMEHCAIEGRTHTTSASKDVNLYYTTSQATAVPDSRRT